MNKERIKSIALMFLVIMNLVLGAKILTDKKLWPYGYNFFLSIKNSDFVKAITTSQDKQSSKSLLAMPEQIIVNTGDQTSRIAVFPNEDIFEEINQSAEGIIKNALDAKADSIYFSPKSEWVSVLGGKSVCFNYPAENDTELFAELFQIYQTAMKGFSKSFVRLVISENNAVYFEDYETGNFYKVKTTQSTDKLVSIINKTRSLHKNNSEIINYSVDLKFDMSFGNQRAVIAPTVPVYSTPVKLPLLTAVNPIADTNGVFDKEIVEKILPIFKINTNTVRRYPEADGTIVFVENNGILKISPKGVLKYQSTDSDGFYLSSGSSYTATVSALAHLADRISDVCMQGADLYLSEKLTPSSDRIVFDYRAKGIPVKIGIEDYTNAISAEIKDGALKSYTQVLRNYVMSSESYDTPAYIQALDEAILKYSEVMNSIEIQKMYLAYTDTGDSVPQGAIWRGEVKSIEINEEDAV